MPSAISRSCELHVGCGELHESCMWAVESCMRAACGLWRATYLAWPTNVLEFVRATKCARSKWLSFCYLPFLQVLLLFFIYQILVSTSLSLPIYIFLLFQHNLSSTPTNLSVNDACTLEIRDNCQFTFEMWVYNYHICSKALFPNLRVIGQYFWSNGAVLLNGFFYCYLCFVLTCKEVKSVCNHWYKIFLSIVI